MKTMITSCPSDHRKENSADRKGLERQNPRTVLHALLSLVLFAGICGCHHRAAEQGGGQEQQAGQEAVDTVSQKLQRELQEKVETEGMEREGPAAEKTGLQGVTEADTLSKMEEEERMERQLAFEKSLDLQMVYVQGGTFTMGATPEQGNDTFKDERYAHPVTLSDYCIGKYEVTQKQWKAVMGNNPSKFKDRDNSDDYPVDNVSWRDVRKFIRKLNKLTGKCYFLPTEAQWEYAARGGNKSKGYKYSGSNVIDEVGWYEDNGENATHRVGMKAPNELGIYDMSGNLWEWCADYWWDNYSADPQTNPRGPFIGLYRVIRGGRWLNMARYCRVSNRSYDAPFNRKLGKGFRLAVLP